MYIYRLYRLYITSKNKIHKINLSYNLINHLQYIYVSGHCPFFRNKSYSFDIPTYILHYLPICIYLIFFPHI